MLDGVFNCSVLLLFHVPWPWKTITPWCQLGYNPTVSVFTCCTSGSFWANCRLCSSCEVHNKLQQTDCSVLFLGWAGGGGGVTMHQSTSATTINVRKAVNCLFCFCNPLKSSGSQFVKVA